MSTARMRRRRRLAALAAFLSVTMVFSAVSTAYAAWNAYQTVAQTMHTGDLGVTVTGGTGTIELPKAAVDESSETGYSDTEPNTTVTGDVSSLALRKTGSLKAVLGVAVTPQLLDTRDTNDVKVIEPSSVALDRDATGLLGVTTVTTTTDPGMLGDGQDKTRWFGPLSYDKHAGAQYYIYVGSFEAGEQAVPALVQSVSLDTSKLAPGALNAYSQAGTGAQESESYQIALNVHVDVDVLQAVQDAASAEWGAIDGVSTTYLINRDNTQGLWDWDKSAASLASGAGSGIPNNFSSVYYIDSANGFGNNGVKGATLTVSPLNSVAPGVKAAQVLGVTNANSGAVHLRAVLTVSDPDLTGLTEEQKTAYQEAKKKLTLYSYEGVTNYPAAAKETWALGTDSKTSITIDLGTVLPGEVAEKGVLAVGTSDPTYVGVLPTLTWSLQAEDPSDQPGPANDAEIIAKATSFVIVNQNGVELAEEDIADVNVLGGFAYGETPVSGTSTDDWKTLKADLTREPNPITIEGGTIRRVLSGDKAGEIELDGKDRLVIVMPTNETKARREWVGGRSENATVYKLTPDVSDKPTEKDQEVIEGATGFVLVNEAGTVIDESQVVSVNSNLGDFTYGDNENDDWKTLKAALLDDTPIVIDGGTIRRGDDGTPVLQDGKLVIDVPTSVSSVKREWVPSRTDDATTYKLTANVTDTPYSDKDVIDKATGFIIKSEDGYTLREVDVTNVNSDLGDFSYGDNNSDDWKTLKAALKDTTPIAISGGTIQRYTADEGNGSNRHVKDEIKLEDGKLVILVPSGVRQVDREWIDTRSADATTYKLTASRADGKKDDLDNNGNSVLVICDQLGDVVDVTRLDVDGTKAETVPSETRDTDFKKAESGTTYEGVNLSDLKDNVVVIANGARLDSSKAAVVVPEGVKMAEVRVRAPQSSELIGDETPENTTVIEIVYVEIESPKGDFPYVVTGDTTKTVTIAPEGKDALTGTDVKWPAGVDFSSFTEPLLVLGGEDEDEQWGGDRMPIWVDGDGRIVVPENVTAVEVKVSTDGGKTVLEIIPTAVEAKAEGVLVFKGRHASGTDTVDVQIPSDWPASSDTTTDKPRQQGVTPVTALEGDGCAVSMGSEDNYIVVADPNVTKVKVTPVYGTGASSYVKVTTDEETGENVYANPVAAPGDDGTYVPFVEKVIVTPIGTKSAENDQLYTVRHADEASDKATVKVSVVNKAPSDVTFEDGVIKTVSHPYVVEGMPLANATVTQDGKTLKDIVVPDGVTAVRLEVREETTGTGDDAVTTTYVTVVPTEWKSGAETPSEAGDKLYTVRHANETSDGASVEVTVENKGGENVTFEGGKIQTVEHPYVVKGAPLAAATETEAGKNLKDIVVPSDVTKVRLEIEDVVEDGITVRHVTVIPTARSGETDPAGLNPIKDLTDATDPDRTDGKTMLVIRNADGDIVEPYKDDLSRDPAAVTDGNLPKYRWPEVTVTGGEVDPNTGELIVPAGVTKVRVETKFANDPDDGDKPKISEIILIPVESEGTIDDPSDNGLVNIIDESGDPVTQVEPYLSSKVVEDLKALKAAGTQLTIWGARPDSLGNLVVPDGTTQARVEPLYDEGGKLIGLHVIPVYYQSNMDEAPGAKPVKTADGEKRYLSLVTEDGKAVIENGPKLDVAKLVTDSDPADLDGDHFFVDGATVDAAGKIQLPRGVVAADVSIAEAERDSSGNVTKITGLKITPTKWSAEDEPLQPKDPDDLKKGLRMVEGDINGNPVEEVPSDAPFDPTTLAYPVTVEGAHLDSSVPGYKTLITPDGVTKARIEPTAWDENGKVTGIKVVPVEWDSRITDDPSDAGKRIDQNPLDSDKTTVVVRDWRGNPLDNVSPAYDENGNPLKDAKGQTVMTLVYGSDGKPLENGTFDYPIATDVIIHNAYADDEGQIVVPYGVTGVQLVPTVVDGTIVEITVNPIRSVQPVDDMGGQPKVNTETIDGKKFPHVIHNSDNPDPAKDTVDLHEPGVKDGSEALPATYTISPNLTVEGGRIDGNGNIVVPDDWSEVKVTYETAADDPTVVTKIVISPTKYGGLNVFEEDFEGTGDAKKSVLGNPVKVYPTDTEQYDRNRVTDRTVVSGEDVVRVEPNVPQAEGTPTGGRNAVMPDGTLAVRITPVGGTYKDDYANGAERYNEVHITTIIDTGKPGDNPDKTSEGEIIVRNESDPECTDLPTTIRSYRPEKEDGKPYLYPSEYNDTITVIGGSLDDKGRVVVPDGVTEVEVELINTNPGTGDGKDDKIDVVVVKPTKWEGKDDDIPVTPPDDNGKQYLTINVIDLKGEHVDDTAVYAKPESMKGRTIDYAQDGYLTNSDQAAKDKNGSGRIAKTDVTDYAVIVKGGYVDEGGNFVVEEGVRSVTVETVIDDDAKTVTVTLRPTSYVDPKPETSDDPTDGSTKKFLTVINEEYEPVEEVNDPKIDANELAPNFIVTGDARLDPSKVDDAGNETYVIVAPSGVTKVRIDVVDTDEDGKATELHVTAVGWKGGNDDVSTGSVEGWVILSGIDEDGTKVVLTPNNFPTDSPNRTTYKDNASFGPNLGLASKGLEVEGAYVKERTSNDVDAGGNVIFHGDEGKLVLPEGVTKANVTAIRYSGTGSAEDKAKYGDDVDTSKIIKLIVTPTEWAAKLPDDDDKFDNIDKRPDDDPENKDYQGIQPKVKTVSGDPVEPYTAPYNETIMHADGDHPLYVDGPDKNGLVGARMEGTLVLNGSLDDAGDIVVPDGVTKARVEVIGYRDDIDNKPDDYSGDPTTGAPVIRVIYTGLEDIPKSDGDDGKTPIVNPTPDDPSKQSLKIVQDDDDRTEIPADKQHRHPEDFDLNTLPEKFDLEGPDVRYDPETGEIIVPDGVTEVIVEELLDDDDKPRGVRITPITWDGDDGRDDDKIDHIDQWTDDDDPKSKGVQIKVVDADGDAVELVPKSILDKSVSPNADTDIVYDSPGNEGSQNVMTLYDMLNKKNTPIDTLDDKDVTVIGGYVDDNGKIRTPQDVTKALVTVEEYPVGSTDDKGETRTKPEVVIYITPLEYAKPGDDIRVERDDDGKKTDELVFINEEGDDVEQLPKGDTDSHIKKSDLVDSPSELGVINGRLGPNGEIIAPEGVTEARLVPVERVDPDDPTSKISVIEIVPVTWEADDPTPVNEIDDTSHKPVIRPGYTDPLGGDDITLHPGDTDIFDKELPKGTIIHGGFVEEDQPFAGDIIIPEGITKVDVYVDETDPDKPVITIVPVEWKSEEVVEPLDGDDIIEKLDKEPNKDGVTLKAVQMDGDPVDVVPSPVDAKLETNDKGELLPVTVEGAGVDPDGNIVVAPWVKEVKVDVEPIKEGDKIVGTKITVTPTKYEVDPDDNPKVNPDGTLKLIDEDHKDVTEDEPIYVAKNPDGSWNLTDPFTVEGAGYDPTTHEIVLPRGTTNARVEPTGKDSEGKKDQGVVVSGTRFETNEDTEKSGPKTTDIDSGTTDSSTNHHTVVFNAADPYGTPVEIIANKELPDTVLSQFVKATTEGAADQTFVVNGATVDADGNIQVPKGVTKIGITPVYRTEKDANGLTRYDENGDPKYVLDANGDRIVDEIYITYTESEGKVGIETPDPNDPDKTNRELIVRTEDGTELKHPEDVIYEPDFDPNDLVETPKVSGDGRLDPEGRIVVPDGTTKVKIEPIYGNPDKPDEITELKVTVLESISDGSPNDAAQRRWIPKLNIINTDGEWVADVSNYNAWKLVNDDILIRGGYDRYTKETNYDLITATVADGVTAVRVEDISWDPTNAPNGGPHLKAEIEKAFNEEHGITSSGFDPLAAIGSLFASATSVLSPAAQDTSSPAGAQDQTIDGIQLVVASSKITNVPATNTRNVSTLVYVDENGNRVQDGSFDAIDPSKLARDANGNITATMDGAYVNSKGEIVLPAGTGEARATAVYDSDGTITKIIVEQTMQAPTDSSALKSPLTVRNDNYENVTNVTNNLDVTKLAPEVTVEGGRIAPDGTLVVDRPGATNVVVNGVDSDGDGKIDRIVVIDKTPQDANDPTVTTVTKTRVNHEGSGTSTLQFVDTRDNPVQDRSNVDLSAVQLANNVVVVGADVDSSGRIVVPEGVTGVTLDVVRNSNNQVTQITVVPTNRLPHADATNTTTGGLLGEDGKRGSASSQKVQFADNVQYSSPREFSLTPADFAADAEIDGPVSINEDGSIKWPAGVTSGELVPIKRDADGKVIKAEARVRQSVKPSTVTPKTTRDTSSGLVLVDVSGNPVIDESQDPIDPSKFANNLTIDGAYFDENGNLVFEDGVQAAMLKPTYDESGRITKIIAQPTRYATDGAASNPALFIKAPQVHDENNQSVTVEPSVDLSQVHDTITVVGQARVDGTGHIVVPENARKVKIDVEDRYEDGSPKVIRVTVTETNQGPVIVGTVFEHNGNQKRSTVTMLTDADDPRWVRDDSSLADPGDPLTENRMSPDGVMLVLNDGISYNDKKQLVAPEGAVAMKLTYETDKSTGKITQVTASLTEKEEDTPAGKQENSANFRMGSGASKLNILANGKPVTDVSVAAIDLSKVERGVKVVGAALDSEGNFIVADNAGKVSVTTADVNGDGSPDRLVFATEPASPGGGTNLASTSGTSNRALAKTGDPAVSLVASMVATALSGLGLLLVSREIRRLDRAEEREGARSRSQARRMHAESSQAGGETMAWSQDKQGHARVARATARQRRRPSRRRDS